MFNSIGFPPPLFLVFFELVFELMITVYIFFVFKSIKKKKTKKKSSTS